jgi:hypothetical protein
MMAGRIEVLIDVDTLREAEDILTNIMMAASKLAINAIVDWSFPGTSVELDKDAADYQPTET